MSILAYAVLGAMWLGAGYRGRECFNSLWDLLDTGSYPVSFEELEMALKELQDAGYIEPVPGWNGEYRYTETYTI